MDLLEKRKELYDKKVCFVVTLVGFLPFPHLSIPGPFLLLRAECRVPAAAGDVLGHHEEPSRAIRG